jgi:hypothetical protein
VGKSARATPSSCGLHLVNVQIEALPVITIWADSPKRIAFGYKEKSAWHISPGPTVYSRLSIEDANQEDVFRHISLGPALHRC